MAWSIPTTGASSPGTLAEDGDPLDALILHHDACPVGCLVECNPLAVLEVEQQEKGKKKQRNDRFLFLPDKDKTMKKDILTAQLKQELEQFFAASVLHSDRRIAFLGWKDAAAALRAIKRQKV